MKLSVGEAIIVVAEKGVNEPFIDGIAWGEEYVIVQEDEEMKRDYKIVKLTKKQKGNKFIIYTLCGKCKQVTPHNPQCMYCKR